MGISCDSSEYCNSVKFKLVPIHKHPELIKETVQLINEQWPRSEGARMHSLTSSRDDLPTCLVLINSIKSSKSDNNEPSVMSHVKLSRIPSLPFRACFLESVVVWKSLRGQGLGRYLMQEAESYCKNNLKLHEIYLSTTDKEEFYKKLGYVPCEPISIFGGPCNFPFRPANQKKTYMKKVLIEDSTINDE